MTLSRPVCRILCGIEIEVWLKMNFSKTNLFNPIFLTINAPLSKPICVSHSQLSIRAPCACSPRAPKAFFAPARETDGPPLACDAFGAREPPCASEGEGKARGGDVPL